VRVPVGAVVEYGNDEGKPMAWVVPQQREEGPAVRARGEEIMAPAMFDPEEEFEFQITHVGPFPSKVGFRAEQILPRGRHDDVGHVPGRRHAFHAFKNDLS
jgi:hypothetical protein